MVVKPFLRPTFLLMNPSGTPVMLDHVDLRILWLPPRRVGPQRLARDTLRTLVGMVRRIAPPAQSRPGPPAAAQLIGYVWKMRANAMTMPPADGGYPREKIVVEHIAQHDCILWPESAALAPVADDVDVNMEWQLGRPDVRGLSLIHI